MHTHTHTHMEKQNLTKVEDPLYIYSIFAEYYRKTHIQNNYLYWIISYIIWREEVKSTKETKQWWIP